MGKTKDGIYDSSVTIVCISLGKRNNNIEDKEYVTYKTFKQSDKIYTFCWICTKKNREESYE